MIEILPDFIPRFLSALLVNFWIAAASLGIGLVVGWVIAAARLRRGLLAWLGNVVTATLRAAPTFVVMFFLINVLPLSVTVAGTVIPLTPTGKVILALSVYSIAYVSDNGLEALRQLRQHSINGAMLFVPNIGKAFFVLFMASSTGAAVGVTESITVTLRAAERLPQLEDRIFLYLFVMAVMFVLYYPAYQTISWIGRRMAARKPAGRAEALPDATTAAARAR